MTHRGLTPEEITEQISAVEARRDRALAEYQAAVEELEWWQEGRRLFESRTERGNDPAKAKELFPPAWVFLNGAKPTLRQAIVALMGEAPGRRWRLSELVEALDEQGWLPGRASRAQSSKGVSDMAAALATDGHLRRVERGVYMLSAELAASLETQRRQDFLAREGSALQDNS